MNKLYIFTDGSCSADTRAGAWTSIIINNKHKEILCGFDFPSTISRCELLPIIFAGIHISSNLNNYRELVFISDSEYTVKVLSGIYTVNKNQELWQAARTALHGFNTKFIWIERNSTPFMVACDAICGSIRKRITDNELVDITKYKEDIKEGEFDPSTIGE